MSKNNMRININESIKVKLTDWGKEIFYHRYDEINEFWHKIVCKPSFPKEDADGYTEFILWDFMHLYGNYMVMGKPEVIKPLEIVYETDINEKEFRSNE